MDITLLLTALLLLAVLAAAGVFIRSQQQKSGAHRSSTRSPAGRRSARADSRKAAAQPRNPFRATSIRTGKSPCVAVQALVTDRFLVEGGDIPALPLPDCDRAARCGCTYAKHGDRRDEYSERRAIGGGGLQDQERRSGSDRRSDD